MSHVTYSFTWQSRIPRCSIIRGIRESCHIFTSVAKKHHVTYSCLMSHLHVHMTWQSRIHRIWETCHIFTSVAKHRVTYSCLWRMNHITYSFTWQSCIHRCTIIRGIWDSGHIFIYVAISHTQVYHNPWDLGLVGNVASVLGTRDAPYNWYLTEWCNWNELCPYMCMSRAPYMYIWIYNMAHSYMCVGHPRCTLQLEFEWMMSHICIWVISHICIYNVTHSYMCVGHPQSTLRLESGRGMASSSRLLKIIGLFCKRAL